MTTPKRGQIDQLNTSGFPFISPIVTSYDELSIMPGTAETDELGSHVIRVIAQTQRMTPSSVSINSTFDELKIDSLDGINIVFALENEFGINIPDDSVQSMRSVRETVEGIRKLLAEKQSAAASPGVG